MAGLLLLLPPWIVSVLWNKLLPKRAVNPWTFPLLFILFFFAMALLGDVSDGTEEAARYQPVIALGLSPAVLLCLFRRKTYQKKAPEASMKL
jgi:hypothetical protein